MRTLGKDQGELSLALQVHCNDVLGNQEPDPVLHHAPVKVPVLKGGRSCAN